MKSHLFFLPFLSLAIACGAPSNDDTAESNDNLTNDGGVRNDKAIAPYEADPGDFKVRYAIDGGPVTEAANVKVDVVRDIKFARRRFKVVARPAPLDGAKEDDSTPSLSIEFGEGNRRIEPGDYRCETASAKFILVDAKGVQAGTDVGEKFVRDCVVHVEETVLLQPHPFYRVMHQTVGTFEAEVGPNDDAKGATRKIRGAFSVMIREPKDL